MSWRRNWKATGEPVRIPAGRILGRPHGLLLGCAALSAKQLHAATSTVAAISELDLGMSLKEDVGEVVKEWGKASWKGRALLLLGLLLSASSIASLADTVFQWKGFLLRGVEFYRTHIAIPTANLVADSRRQAHNARDGRRHGSVRPLLRCFDPH